MFAALFRNSSFIAIVIVIVILILIVVVIFWLSASLSFAHFDFRLSEKPPPRSRTCRAAETSISTLSAANLFEGLYVY